MKKLIVALLFTAVIGSINAGYAQTTKKHHKKAIAGCPVVPAKHHKKSLAKHHAVKHPAMRYETITVNDRSNLAIVEIKKGNILVNDSFVAKLTNPKYEDDNIIINYIAPPPPQALDLSKENNYSANIPSAGKPMLGVYTCNYFDEGAMIEGILPCGPAAEAGLYPGDVIMKINDQDINNSCELIDAIGKYNAGDNISITYMHFGRMATTEADLADKEKTGKCYCSE